MPYLSFLEDVVLEKIISDLLYKEVQSEKKIEKTFNKNVIDPFTLLFEMAEFGITFDEWKKNETIRQSQKTLANRIGNFHQKILGAVKGFENLKTGTIVDIVNHDLKIIAELKNKHNTLTATFQANLYDTLEKEVMNKNGKHRGYAAYYVEIIPKKPERYNVLFVPSDNTKGQRKQENPLIRKIDGHSFYALATGNEDALEQLYIALPKVISKFKPEFENLDYQNAKSYFDKAYSST